MSDSRGVEPNKMVYLGGGWPIGSPEVEPEMFDEPCRLPPGIFDDTEPHTHVEPEPEDLDDLCGPADDELDEEDIEYECDHCGDDLEPGNEYYCEECDILLCRLCGAVHMDSCFPREV